MQNIFYEERQTHNFLAQLKVEKCPCQHLRAAEKHLNLFQVKCGKLMTKCSWGSRDVLDF